MSEKYGKWKIFSYQGLYCMTGKAT